MFADAGIGQVEFKMRGVQNFERLGRACLAPVDFQLGARFVVALIVTTVAGPALVIG